MDMMWAVAAGGLVLLIVLAVIVGLDADRRARDAAWVRIGLARRRLHDEQADLREREADLERRIRKLAERERLRELRRELDPDDD